MAKLKCPRPDCDGAMIQGQNVNALGMLSAYWRCNKCGEYRESKKIPKRKWSDRIEK